MDMNRKTLTDSEGDTLEFRAYTSGRIFVEACDGNGFGIAGPFTSEQLRAALDEVAPAGSHPRTSEDWKARAEKAEEERDHLATVLATTARQRDEADKRNARPLTPDAITDEMVERAREEFFGGDVGGPVSGPSSARRWRAALTAALTPEPARPDGAEEIEAVLREEWTFSDEDGGGDAFGDLAQRLASRGVRVVGEDGAA